MNPPVIQPRPGLAPRPALPPEKALRRLFLMLFLRGRSSRGQRKGSAPTSIGRKLWGTIAIYALFGAFAFAFTTQPLFTLALYLHGMTFVFLGMFVAASAGEVLFNKEEADILMHRPIAPRTLLWAKIRVLVEVSFWLTAAFNLIGFFVGVSCKGGSWLFPIVHASSAALEALFCTGTVVLVYQLCLRWFGRERLENLMTMAQVLIAIIAVTAGQVVPRLIGHFGGVIQLDAAHWWIALLPPAWFAGLDDALVGGGGLSSWLLASVGLALTGMVLWLAFGKLARGYEAGMQVLNEAAAPRRKKSRASRGWWDRIVTMPPLRWFLPHPVARASFLLTIAYLLRDRDVKLRVYPGLAPMLVIPFIFLLQDGGRSGSNGFGVAFTGVYLGLIPMMGLNLMQYSQQWPAADLFRIAPIAGPAQICNGARWAVLIFLTLPLLVVIGLAAWFLRGQNLHAELVLPGLIALPIYALIPCVGGKAVPLSLPTEEAKSAGRGIRLVGVMIISSALAGLSLAAWSGGWFRWLLLSEAVVGIALYAWMRLRANSARWQSME